MKIKRLLIILVFLFLPLNLYVIIPPCGADGFDSPSGFDTGSTFNKITIREKPAPSAVTDTGQFYVDPADNSLHYLSETGTDTQVVGDSGVVGGGGGGWTDSAPHVTVTDTTDNVSMGTSTANAKLDVQGSAIFNDDGADVDFRVEGDTDASLLKVDAGLDYVGIGTDTPTSKLDVNGTVTANKDFKGRAFIGTGDNGKHFGNFGNTGEPTFTPVEGDFTYSNARNRYRVYTDASTAYDIPGTDTVDILQNKTVELDGIPDSDDTYFGITINSYNAGENLTQWDSIYFHATDPDKLHQADADAAAEFPARGIVVATASDTNAAIVLTQGSVRNDAWSWTPGAIIYLSDTAGGLTSTAPSTSGDCVQIMGWATATDTAYINVSGHYLLAK